MAELEPMPTAISTVWAALEMTAARRGVTLSDDDRAQILGPMRTLPPYPEIPESLARLRVVTERILELEKPAGR